MPTQETTGTLTFVCHTMFMFHLFGLAVMSGDGGGATSQ